MSVKRSLLLLLIVPAFALLGGCAGFDPNAYVPGLYTSTPTPFDALTIVPETERSGRASPAPLQTAPVTPSLSETPVIAAETVDAAETQTIVCTNIPGGKLNVRFEPGEQSDVRGYLVEGETVMLDGDRQDVNGNAWVRLTHPIEGWVNETYLCEEP